MTNDAKADLLLTGGPIFLGLQAGFAEALALSGERMLAAGSAITRPRRRGALNRSE